MAHKHSSRGLVLAATMTAFVAGCGANETLSERGGASQTKGLDAMQQTKGPQRDDATLSEGASDIVVLPPPEYYQAALQRKISGLSLAGSSTQVLWINFNGAAVQKGNGPGQSFIPCQATSTIPAAGFSADEQTQIVQIVQGFYQRAHVQLFITTKQPASGDYTAVHVGGTYHSLGCIGAGVLGIAPLDKGNADPADIVFAFSDTDHDVKAIGETIAHEAGHSFGLEHDDNPKSVMYPVATDSVTDFLAGHVYGTATPQDDASLLRQNLGTGDATIDSGNGAVPPLPTNTASSSTTSSSTSTTSSTSSTSSNGTTASSSASGSSNSGIQIPGLGTVSIPGLSGIPGLGNISSIGDLLSQLGGGNLLNLGNLSSSLGQLLGGGTSGGLSGILPNLGQLPGLDKILTIFNLGQSASSGSAGGIGDVLSKIVQSLPQGKGLSGLLNGAGFGSIGDALGSLQGAISQASSGHFTQPTPEVTSLKQAPNLLGIAQMANAHDLLVALNGQKALIDAAYKGPTHDALMTLLKLGYGQALAKLPVIP